MGTRLVPLALLASLWATPSLAETQATIGIVSDHIDRGISNSDGHASLQAGLAWTGETGLFLAVDGSTVDYNDGTDAEVNFIAGQAWEWDRWALVAGISRTHYAGAPKGSGMDLWEFALAAALDLETHQWEAELIYSPDDGGAGDALYQRIGAIIPLTDQVALAPHIGHQWYDRKDLGGPAYWDWGLELSYALSPATVGIAYTGTSLDREPGCLCGHRVALFVSVTYP